MGVGDLKKKLMNEELGDIWLFSTAAKLHDLQGVSEENSRT